MQAASVTTDPSPESVKLLPTVERARRPDRSERRLVARLRRGDEAALHEVYDRCGPATFGFLVATLGDRMAAEDVQQQVFTELWKRAPSYDPERASLVTWAMTIARSRAIDHLRRRVPEPRDPAGAVALAETADEPVPFVDELAERWRMAALLARLPDDEAGPLRMRFYDGLSQAEIASRTDVPLGTVKARMVRGLARLRELLEAEEAGR